MPESLIEYTKNVSYEVFIIFHILNYVSRCGNIPKFWFKAPELSLFIYLFIHLWNIGNTVYVWPIMKNQKQPFTSIKKTAAEFFFKIHWKAPEQESHYNKISCLKPAILLKKRLQHRCFTVSFSKFFRTATFNNISRWLFLVPCKFANRHVANLTVHFFNKQPVYKQLV